MNYFFPEGVTIDKKSDLLQEWLCLNPEELPTKVLTIPFYNLNTNKISQIPLTMAQYYFGTNGMAAGNTLEEALVQGLCEIIERYVTKEIINQSIIPPTIPDGYLLEKHTNIYKIKEQIERKGDYKVIFKDCSLNKGFPVVGLIFIDQGKQEYFVRFGSHPVLNIALERTLTELFQGRELGKMEYISEYSFMNNENVCTETNKMQIILDGVGYYPNAFFCEENPTYSFSEFKDDAGLSNKKMLDYLIELLLADEKTILVRDVSLTGFPSVQIIVPEITHIRECSDRLGDIIKSTMKINQLAKDLNSASTSDLEYIIQYLTSRINTSRTLADLLDNLPIDYDFPWRQVKIDVFLSAAYYKIRDYQNSYRAMDRVINEMQYQQKKYDWRYYKCVRDYIAALSKDYKKLQIIDILSKIYGQKMVQDVIYDLDDPDKIFQYYGRINCWECTECDFRNNCYYENIEKIYIKFKNIQKHSDIDQTNLQYLFNI